LAQPEFIVIVIHHLQSWEENKGWCSLRQYQQLPDTTPAERTNRHWLSTSGNNFSTPKTSSQCNMNGHMQLLRCEFYIFQLLTWLPPYIRCLRSRKEILPQQTSGEKRNDTFKEHTHERMPVHTHKGKRKTSEWGLSSSLQSYRKFLFVCFVTEGLLRTECMQKTIQVHHCFPEGLLFASNKLHESFALHNTCSKLFFTLLV